jgi:SAM-dependent methyltransferase
MPDNTHRFTGRAEDYNLYRQRYPTEEVLAHLRTWCGLTSDWLVADVGAGTGMVAEIFLENGNRVLAIEPNADMRDQMHKTFDGLGKCWPSLEIIDATAEATALPDASIDLIAVGRAFHWFDKDRALAEFRRILKPGGWVTLVAVDRDRDSSDPAFHDQIEGFEHLLATHGTDYTRIRAGYRTYDKMDNFLDGELHQAQLPGSRSLDWTTFRGHTMSLSVTPQPSDPGFEAFESDLRLYFDRFANAGILTLPTICWMSAGRFRDQ